MSITANIIGTSTIRLEFTPKIVDESGKENGESVTATPKTRTILKRFAPIILPTESALCPFISAVIAVTSSGKDVPRATKVRLWH